MQHVSHTAKKVVLSAEQSSVIGDVQAGRNVLATGSAGTGKSTLLARLQQEYGDRLCVTASTGIAAINVKGTTFHRFAGLRPADKDPRQVVKRIEDGGAARSNILNCDVLAIDEISMLSARVFDMANDVFKMVRGNSAPFGGVQLFLTGDFLQLPPVSGADEPNAKFAFESRAWKEAAICGRFLTKVFRQQDQQFADALGRLRVGDIEHPLVNLLAGRNNIPLPADGVRPTMIHTHNRDVDYLNLRELAALPGDEQIYLATDEGSPHVIQRLDKECLAPRELRLKRNAQVMLLVNYDLDAGLGNGSIGTVEEMLPDGVKVRFGTRVVEIDSTEFEVQNNGRVLATRHQIPLRLAWALTSHKTQGLTLERVQCHLEHEFEYGQSYVAVSRVKSLEGLFLRRCRRQNFRAHPVALEFYRALEAAPRATPTPRQSNERQDELFVASQDGPPTHCLECGAPVRASAEKMPQGKRRWYCTRVDYHREILW